MVVRVAADTENSRMTTLSLELPENVLAALRCAPEDFSGEMRLAAAITWYEEGKISQEIASQVAGLCRTDFLLALAGRAKDSFRVDEADLDRELSRG
jgi:predicted HTH domain antitoxin